MTAHKTTFRLALMTFSLAAAGPALSASDDSKTTLPNDKNNYIGDNLRFEVDTLLGSGDDAVCLRRGDPMKVIGLKQREGDKKNFFVLRFNKDSGDIQAGKCQDGKTTVTTRPADSVPYELPVSALDELGGKRSGWTYGMLVVPFKYVLAGDRGMRGASTVGGYVGFRRPPMLGVDVSLVGFAGATVISVQKSESGVTKSTDNAGLSAGVGVITTLKDSFQLGAVLGWDMVSRDAQYAGNYKPWVAIQIGYSFLQ